MFTVAYSAIGIPLALIMFQSIGERMKKLSSVIIQKLRTWMLDGMQTEGGHGAGPVLLLHIHLWRDGAVQHSGGLDLL